MENKKYGYVRVSSADQNEARQLMALEPAQVPIHIISGSNRGQKFENPLFMRVSACSNHSSSFQCIFFQYYSLQKTGNNTDGLVVFLQREPVFACSTASEKIWGPNGGQQRMEENTEFSYSRNKQILHNHQTRITI